MKLAANVYGEGGTPVVVAHGLNGSGRNWSIVAKRLADDRHVIAVDMRNHGDSPWSDDQSYAAMANDLAEVAPHPFDLVGHSMGGKAAMVLALTRPAAIRRLVVVDIAPVAYEHTQIHTIDAMRSADLSTASRRSEVSLGIGDPAVEAFLLQSLDLPNRRWRLNLDVLAKQMDDLVGWPKTEGRFDGPALFLRGGASEYVPDAHLPKIKRLFPSAQIATIEGAGHWLHAEHPREVEAEIRRFLAN